MNVSVDQITIAINCEFLQQASNAIKLLSIHPKYDKNTFKLKFFKLSQFTQHTTTSTSKQYTYNFILSQQWKQQVSPTVYGYGLGLLTQNSLFLKLLVSRKNNKIIHYKRATIGINGQLFQLYENKPFKIKEKQQVLKPSQQRSYQINQFLYDLMNGKQLIKKIKPTQQLVHKASHNINLSYEQYAKLNTFINKMKQLSIKSLQNNINNMQQLLKPTMLQLHQKIQDISCIEQRKDQQHITGDNQIDQTLLSLLSLLQKPPEYLINQSNQQASIQSKQNQLFIDDQSLLHETSSQKEKNRQRQRYFLILLL